MPRVSGCILPPESRVAAKRKSDHAHRNENNAAVIRPLRLEGSTIDTNDRHGPAPSILAACNTSSGTEAMNEVRISAANGTAIVESARTSPHTVFVMPSLT